VLLQKRPRASKWRHAEQGPHWGKERLFLRKRKREERRGEERRGEEAERPRHSPPTVLEGGKRKEEGVRSKGRRERWRRRRKRRRRCFHARAAG